MSKEDIQVIKDKLTIIIIVLSAILGAIIASNL